MKKTGNIIVILGLALTIFMSVNLFANERIVNTGQAELSRNKPGYFDWSPLLGVTVIGIGGAFLAGSVKK